MALKILDDSVHVRKVSFAFLIVSLIAWVIYIPFFGLNFDNRDRIDIRYFPHWCFLFTGLVVHTLAILHLLLGHRHTAVLLHAFNTLYLACGGVIVYTDWAEQYVVNKEVKFLLEFVACTLSLISLTISLMLLPLIRDVDSSRSYKTDQDEETVDARYLPQPISMVPLSAPNATVVSETDKTGAAATEKQDPEVQYDAILPHQRREDLPSIPPLPEVHVAANIAADDQELYEDIHPVTNNERDDDTEVIYADAEDTPSRSSNPSHEQLGEYVVNELVYEDAEANALVDQPEEDYVINQLVYEERVEDYEALT